MLKKSLFVGLMVLEFSAFAMDEAYSKLEDNEPAEKATEGVVVQDLSQDEIKLRLEVLDEVIEVRKKFIKIFGDIKCKDVFFRAVETNNLALAKFCFENVIGDINSKNEKNQTPLMLAVKELDLDMVKLLLESKASVHHVDSNGDNALHYIMKCCPASAAPEVKKSVSIISVDSFYSKLEDIIELLLNHGININSCDNNGDTLLIKCLKYKANFKVVKILCKFNPDINVINKSGMTAVNYASSEEHIIITDEIRCNNCCVIL